MRNSKKLSILFLLTFMVAVFTTGCGLDFDASGYIQACLDANSHGEYEAYAKITGTTVEEAEQQFNDRMDQEIAYLDMYDIDEDKKAKFRELFVNMYDQFKYEVGEAVKNDDGSYSVPVTTYKLMAFKDVMKDGEEHMTTYAQQQIDAGNTPSVEDLYAVAIDFMYDYISKNLENLEYADAVNTTITVAPTSSDSRVYAADDYEMQALIESLVDIENAQ